MRRWEDKKGSANTLVLTPTVWGGISEALLGAYNSKSLITCHRAGSPLLGHTVVVYFAVSRSGVALHPCIIVKLYYAEQ